jgi:hypothetical protein
MLEILVGGGMDLFRALRMLFHQHGKMLKH